jgi:transcriptional regulator with XRE-family HTH domain
MNHLGKNLQNLREKAGLTQRDLADKFGYKTPQFISNWERGVAAPPISVIKKLAKMLHIEADKLFDVILSSEVEDFKKRRYAQYKKAR